MVPIAMLAMVATSPGQTFGISIFNPSFRQTLGLSHSQLTGTYMVGTLLAALPQPFIGGMMDRFGIRRVMFIIVVFLGLACIFMSQVQNLLMLLLAFFFLRLLGQGALTLLANNSLAMWFQVRLGTAAGMMSAAFAGAIALIPSLVLALINLFGWRGAYASLGVIVWLVMLPIILLFFRNRPEDVGQSRDGSLSLDGGPSSQISNIAEVEEEVVSFTLKEARHSKAYWLLISTSVAFSMILTAIFFNIIPIFADHGLTDANAAATYTTLALALGVMQLIGGALADRIPLNWLISLSLIFLIGSVWALSQADSMALAQLYAVFAGIGQGLFGAVSNTAWVRYYGRAHLGRIRGSVAVAFVAGSSAGPFIMGATYDLTGSYQISLSLFIALLIPLAIATYWTTPPKLPGDEVLETSSHSV